MCLQVLTPVMGWVRNYHAYQFNDRKDGATWGPQDSNAIDMMHMHLNGFDFLDDRKTRLAEILQVFAMYQQTSMLCMFALLYADYSWCRLVNVRHASTCEYAISACHQVGVLVHVD